VPGTLGEPFAFATAPQVRSPVDLGDAGADEPKPLVYVQHSGGLIGLVFGRVLAPGDCHRFDARQPPLALEALHYSLELQHRDRWRTFGERSHADAAPAPDKRVR
jgi:hypothetical protein